MAHDKPIDRKVHLEFIVLVFQFLVVTFVNNNKYLIIILCFVHQMHPIGCLLLLLWITAISIINPLTTLISWMNTTHGKIREPILGEWMFHDMGSLEIMNIINKRKIIRKYNKWKILANMLENSVWYYTFYLRNRKHFPCYKGAQNSFQHLDFDWSL